MVLCNMPRHKKEAIHVSISEYSLIVHPSEVIGRNSLQDMKVHPSSIPLLPPALRIVAVAQDPRLDFVHEHKLETFGTRTETGLLEVRQ